MSILTTRESSRITDTRIESILYSGTSSHARGRTSAGRTIQTCVRQFVAHPNVQQLLASIWYESVPGFRRKNMLLQALEMARIGALFPLHAAAYIAAPHSAPGRTLRKPFIKFLCHSASYFMFLCECIRPLSN